MLPSILTPMPCTFRLTAGDALTDNLRAVGDRPFGVAGAMGGGGGGAKDFLLLLALTGATNVRDLLLSSCA